jgi:hypothetical protein
VGTLTLLAGVLCAGCGYLQDRGNDALDIFDVGVTVSKDPGLSVYCGFNSILPVGFAYMDGWLLGSGGRHVGIVPARNRGIGLVLWGEEQIAYKDFDGNDPKSPPLRRVGILGLIQGPIPDRRNILACPKLLHLGWIGLTLNCKIGEAIDFLVGLTTIDIMKDDVSVEEKRPEVRPAT